MLEIVWNIVFEIAAGALGDHLEDSYEKFWDEIERQGKIAQLSDAISAFLNKEAELKKLIDNIKEEIEKKREPFPEDKKNKLHNFLMMIANNSEYRSTFKQSLETTVAFQKSIPEQQKHIKDFFCVVADICVEMLGSETEEIKEYCKKLAEDNKEHFKKFEMEVKQKHEQVMGQLKELRNEQKKHDEKTGELLDEQRLKDIAREGTIEALTQMGVAVSITSAENDDMQVKNTSKKENQ